MVPDVALKEWAVIVRALEQGRQSVLLRKGGIHEGIDGFRVSHPAFLLMPTYFHQQRDGVRPEALDLLEAALSSEPVAGQIVITSWAEVVDCSEVQTEAELEALEARHVLNRAEAVARLRGVHGRALFAIHVRVHLLEEPRALPVSPSMLGCRSWVSVG
jgi:hypothetical protein